MESPRRRHGGAEQPTCWSSVVRFPLLVFPARPAVGPRGPASATTRPAVKTSFRENHDRLRSVDPSASDVSAFPSARFPPRRPRVSRATRARPARVASSSRRCAASIPPPGTRTGGTRAGPSPPRITIRRSSRAASPCRPPPGTSFPGSARPRRPRSRARHWRRRRAATPRDQATEARRAADRATTCAASRRAAAAPRAKANSKNRSTASLLLLARRCGERSAGSYENHRKSPKSAPRVRRSRERVTNGSSRGMRRARGGAVSTANARRSPRETAKGKRKRATTARIPSRFRGTSRRG